MPDFTNNGLTCTQARAQGWQPSLWAGAALQQYVLRPLLSNWLCKEGKATQCWPAQGVPFDFLDPANSHKLWAGQSGTRTSLQWVPRETALPQWTEWGGKGDRDTFTASKVKGGVFRWPENHSQLRAKASLVFNNLRKMHNLPWWELACKEYQELQH